MLVLVLISVNGKKEKGLLLFFATVLVYELELLSEINKSQNKIYNKELRGKKIQTVNVASLERR